MSIELATLNPVIKDGVLMFDCLCGKHRIRIPIQEDKKFKSNGAWWKLDGNLPNVTAYNPTNGPRSFDASPCFHLTLTNGVLS